MVTYFINIIFTAIDCLLMVYIYQKSGYTQSTRRCFFLVFSCLVLRSPVFLFVLGNLGLKEPINLMASLFIYAFIGVLMKVEKSNIILWSCVFVSISLISENIAGIIQRCLFTEQWFPMSTSSINQYFSETLISSVIRIILIVLIFSLLSRKQFDQIPKLPNKMILLLSIIPIASIIVLCTITLWWHSHLSLPVIGLLGIDLGITSITIFNLLVFRLIQIHIIELTQEQASKVVTKKEIQYFAELEYKEQQLRIMRHDLKNQYLVIAGYIESKDYDLALNYINKSVIKMDHSLTRFYTNNQILNYILNQKAQQARENNILVEIKALIPANFQIENSIIASLLGNLIDNALNACIRQKNVEKKINISLKLSNDNLIINIDNTFDSTEVLTRKWRMKEGIGLKSVRHIVDKQNGLYKYWFDDNTYHVLVVLMKIYERKNEEE